MSLAVKNISVTYNPINKSNTFTSGDFISGQVILDVEKHTQMQSLSVKIEGKAEVFWTEHHSKFTVYSDEEKYYSVKNFFVRGCKTHGNEMLKDPSGQPYPSVVAPGRHVYPFTFRLPVQHFPPTFKGSVGKVVYALETKLSRSMCTSIKDKKEFHYIPRPDVSNPELMAPQCEIRDKKMHFFTSGSVSMNINTEKMGYYHGEGLKVLAEFQNNSTRAVKPKYCLYEKHSFFARGTRRLHTHDLFKEEGEPIEPNSKKTVTKILTIPSRLAISILNCRILKVEYRLRICLDVPYALDLEINFPVVILPPKPVSGATNSDSEICNQPTGSYMYPNPPPFAPPQPNVGPSGQFGAPDYYRPPLNQFSPPGYPGQSAPPSYPGPPSQFAPPSYPGPTGQSAPPSYPGTPGQSAPPSYPGLPGQFAPPSYLGPSGESAPPSYLGPSGQSAPPSYPGPPVRSPSAPPPYQEYQLFQQFPEQF